MGGGRRVGFWLFGAGRLGLGGVALLLGGGAGVGKPEAGMALAQVLDTPLIRLQCYDGIDAAEALYEWNYQKQLLRLQADEVQGLRWEDVSGHLF